MTGKKLDLRNPIFHNDDKAREHLEALLWPDGPFCPRCGVMGDGSPSFKARARALDSTIAKTAVSHLVSRSEP